MQKEHDAKVGTNRLLQYLNGGENSPLTDISFRNSICVLYNAIAMEHFNLSAKSYVKNPERYQADKDSLFDNMRACLRMIEDFNAPLNKLPTRHVNKKDYLNVKMFVIDCGGFKNYCKTIRDNADFLDTKFVPDCSHRVNSLAFDFVSQLVETPSSIEEAIARLQSFTHASRLAVAENLNPILNSTIQAMPSGTLEEKKAICDFVAQTLDPLGLAVKCPNTPGLPGKLKATTGHWPEKGRFHFEAYIDGKLKKPAVSDTLPQLELIDSVVQIGTAIQPAETSWQDTVGTKESRQGRKLS